MAKLTEKELIAGCIENDYRSQKELYSRYCGAMMGVCVRYAPTVTEAEDLLQDGFVKVFRKLDTFQNKGSLGGWIKRIMINTCLQFYRDNKNLNLYVEMNEGLIQEEASFDVLAQMSADDLRKKIQSLPDGYRVVFNMYAIEGFNHQEIADRLNIGVGTSKSQLSRARAYLKKLIEQEEKLEAELNGAVV